ncbi:hypothetical protein AKJ49_01135 [candidate division MSBL1 archaeon SCGC-AAA382A03]|uniref:HTH cro/C1-type domain-containing protein n=1 Tax=candidate division MSBL1 archaeon SCGC-AAA382A03 TaxID=1698278 RepID=A0A133VFS5_9EURY|nr:hypothetical protein AKJ49_01135 [candidate division MSBL1 archaeon SCGC-AAA382A03]
METRFDGLSEFISRKGRMKIIRTLLEEFKTQKEIAKRLNITKNAVNGWLNKKDKHPNNKHVKEMLEILKNKNEEKLNNILFEELQIFQKLLLKF